MTATVTTTWRDSVPRWLLPPRAATEASGAASLPRGLFAGAVMLTLAVVALGMWNAWTLSRDFDRLARTELRLERLAATVVRLDEVLTMSARMAALTGNPRWEERYNRNAPVLDEAIARAVAIAPREPVGATLQSIGDTNDRLVALEREAISLARENRRRDAVAILESPGYSELKDAYADGLSQGLASIHDRVDREVRAHSSRAAVVLALDGLAGLALMLGWLWVIQLVRSNADERAALVRDLDEAVRARDDFLALASHELRTPLNALSLSVQSLVARAGALGLPAVASDKLAIAERQVERLDVSIGALLDVSRITSGRLFMELEDGVDLVAVAHDVVEKYGEQAASAKCEVRLGGDLGPIAGRWDKARLEQIVGNLLSNAIKYGPGRPIDIELSADERCAEIVVRDYGIGIPSDKQAAVFERFERAVLQSEYGGVGLGLWIVREVVSAMGGHVTVESRPGEGASFSVSIPKQPNGGRSRSCTPR